jgi:hypothetical protein
MEEGKKKAACGENPQTAGRGYGSGSQIPALILEYF